MQKRQKAIIVFLCIFFVVMMMIGTIDIRKGESEDIIYISNSRELMEFAQNVNEGNKYEDVHVILTADIDLAEIPDFTPIGKWDQGNYFYGIFDGAGHTIRNLTLVSDGNDVNLGLFGNLGGVICNLTLEDCYLQGSACGAFCCIAAGDGRAAILNCQVRNAEIDALYTDIYGGQYFGIIENCIIDGQGDLQEQNSSLERLMGKYGITTWNRWTEGEDGLVLSKERAYMPEKVYLTINDIYDGEMYPVYFEEEDANVFCIPATKNRKDAVLTLEMPDGSLIKEEIIVPDVKELKYTYGGEEFVYLFKESANTATVFLDIVGDGDFAFLRESKSNMLPGTVQIIDENGERQYVGELERIRGRGNDSWLQDKQSFGLKLMKIGDVLGMGREKDFVLIPGYRNASLLTYQIIWDMCKEMNWDYALSGKMVQLFVDGKYWGVYFLSEKIEAGVGRIEVEQTAEKSGGFVFEYDMNDYTEIDVRVETERGNSIIFNSPIAPNKKQKEYSLNLWNDFEDALYSPDGYNSKGKHYTEYIDLQSFAAQWLFYELNAEWSVMSSVYFYKNADNTGDGKLYAYQPWDVEHSFAFEEWVEKNRMLDTNDFWRAMASHKDFADEVRRQWENRFLPTLEKLLSEGVIENTEGVSSLDYYVEQLRLSSEMEEIRWGDDQNVEEKAESIRKWMKKRIPYLQEQLYRDEYYLEYTPDPES